MSGPKRIPSLRTNASIWCQVQISCGFGVPLIGNGTPAEVKDSPNSATPYDDRPTLRDWAGKMLSSDKLFDYRKKNNCKSLDGLPGLKCVRRAEGHSLWMDLLQTRTKRIFAQKDALATGVAFTLLIMFLMRIAGIRV